MEAALVSLVIVAAAEMGDRTQLLALMLSAHFRKPWTVLAGILCATLANHAAAGALGTWIGTLLTPALAEAAAGIGTLAMAAWMLKPERPSAADPEHRRSAFLATVIAIFIAEFGDKTQLATVALGAGYGNLAAVVVGTTCGMALADAPAVLLGKAFAERLPHAALRYGAAALFAALGAFFIAAALSHQAAH